MIKHCSTCGTEKPIESFHRNPKTKDKRNAKCASCSSEYYKSYYSRVRRERGDHKFNNRSTWSSKLKQKFGITADDYDQMLENQNGVCKICLRTEPSGTRLAVDHCHSTGKIRGLLCSNCNKGIGMFQDQPSLLNSAINYLNEN